MRYIQVCMAHALARVPMWCCRVFGQEADSAHQAARSQAVLRCDLRILRGFAWALDFIRYRIHRRSNREQLCCIFCPPPVFPSLSSLSPHFVNACLLPHSSGVSPWQGWRMVAEASSLVTSRFTVAHGFPADAALVYSNTDTLIIDFGLLPHTHVMISARMV